MIRVMTAAAGAVLMAGCTTMGSTTADTGSTRGATAVLRMADGTEVGRAVATEASGGIRVSLDASKLPAGPHGAHVHTTGRCDGPDFTTAGGHWNPTNMKHGTENPMGPHAGDFPNVQIAADGRGKLEMMLPSGTMAGLMDDDGAAFVIHAAADDYKTDPSGNSGGRIACGVFERS
ncbi:superoxide dismutase family protein [Sphingomonas floccifaciens]|uniref:Superoxide dismutase family protein n=1 Tax=Sphingomonas floccifaciens TaxID=1844115 RepID=A0ABW4ND84_9SPHN